MELQLSPAPSGIANLYSCVSLCVCVYYKNMPKEIEAKEEIKIKIKIIKRKRRKVKALK